MICDFKTLRIRILILAVLRFKNVVLLVVAAKWRKIIFCQFYRTAAAILVILIVLFGYRSFNLPTTFVLGKWQKYYDILERANRWHVLKGQAMRRIFWGFCINQFGIGPFHLTLHFEPFRFWLRIHGPYSPSQGVNKIAYRYNFFKTFN
jgi:hypothetical protein